MSSCAWQPERGFLRPYLDIFAGLNVLSTDTRIDDGDWDDDSDGDIDINTASDTAFAFGAGAGVQFPVIRLFRLGRPSGRVAGSGFRDPLRQHSETVSQSDTVSQSITESQSQTVSQSHSTAQSETWGVSGSESDSVANTESRSTSQNHVESTSQARSEGKSTSQGQVIGRGISSGMSVGVAPSFSLSNSYQWQDDPSILLTDIMRTQRKLLDIASREGAFYTDVYALARSEQGAQALMGLIPEAFHGTEDVVTGVQTRTLSARNRPISACMPAPLPHPPGSKRSRRR